MSDEEVAAAPMEIAVAVAALGVNVPPVTAVVTAPVPAIADHLNSAGSTTEEWAALRRQGAQEPFTTLSYLPVSGTPASYPLAQAPAEPRAWLAALGSTALGDIGHGGTVLCPHPLLKDRETPPQSACLQFRYAAAMDRSLHIPCDSPCFAPRQCLDCGKCYERVPLTTLESFALESGYPLYALFAALDMYAGRRRLLPAPRLLVLLTHEPALVNRAGVGTVWTDGSGRHSSDPQHRRCGVGYYTDMQE
eukprot:6460055-Amphidinium_carterae.1